MRNDGGRAAVDVTGKILILQQSNPEAFLTTTFSSANPVLPGAPFLVSALLSGMASNEDAKFLVLMLKFAGRREPQTYYYSWPGAKDGIARARYVDCTVPEKNRILASVKPQLLAFAD